VTALSAAELCDVTARPATIAGLAVMLVQLPAT
jgi:hypothetical protein